jgi:three-Cys-motif partner protein
MTRSQDHFDAFEPHTRMKHAILRAYLGTWAMKLLQWRRGGPTVYFVDAFAGPGKDNEGNPGSPLIAARIAAQTQGHLRRGAIPDATMRVIAIEKKSTHHRSLSDLVRPFNAGDADAVTVLRGELPEHIDAIGQRTGQSPTLYFLDPFGVKGLDASTYPKALAGPSNEMFALFADMGTIRLHGVVNADKPDIERQIRALRQQLALLPEVEEDAAREDAALRARAAEREAALDQTIPASREHLTRALGGEDWVERLRDVPPGDRADTFLSLFVEKLIESGARKVLSVPMRNDAGQHVYSLVHASKSAKGFVAMKESVSAGLRSGELSQDVCEAIRADLSIPLPPIVELLRATFAGTTVRWTAERGSDEETIRRFVLEETSMFDFQLDSVKDALARAGYIPLGKTGKPKTPIIVTFPAQPSA